MPLPRCGLALLGWASLFLSRSWSPRRRWTILCGFASSDCPCENTLPRKATSASMVIVKKIPIKRFIFLFPPEKLPIKHICQILRIVVAKRRARLRSITLPPLAEKLICPLLTPRGYLNHPGSAPYDINPKRANLHPNRKRCRPERARSHVERERSHAERERSHAERERSHVERERSHAERERSMWSVKDPMWKAKFSTPNHEKPQYFRQNNQILA